MFHSYLQGLVTTVPAERRQVWDDDGNARSVDDQMVVTGHQTGFKILDRDGKRKEQQRIEEAIRRVRDMHVGKIQKNEAPAGAVRARKQAWEAGQQEEFKQDREFYDDMYLSVSERYNDSDEEYSKLQLKEDSASEENVSQEHLINTILELEKDRDAKVSEIAELQRSKLEAENRAREAAKKSLELSRRARAAIQSQKLAWNHESDLSDEDLGSYVDREMEEAKNREEESYAKNTRLIRQVRRDDVMSERKNFVDSSIRGLKSKHGSSNKNKGAREAHGSSLLSNSSSVSSSLSRPVMGCYRRSNNSALSDFSDLNLSIRDKKMLLLAREENRKRREEEEHLSVQIRAKPVPSSTLLPKYRQMQQVERARSLSRKLERKEKLEREAQPFKGLELRAQKQAARKKEREQIDGNMRRTKQGNNRDDSPKNISSTKPRAPATDQERRERRDQRAQRLLHESRLPPRLEQYASMERSRKKQNVHEHSFKPQITGRVPDFERTKEKWATALNRARQTSKPTKPNVSDLSMFSAEADERNRKREQRRKEQQLKENKVRQNEEKRLRRQVTRVQQAAASSRAIVYMTKSEELRLNKCAQAKFRREQEEKRKKEAAAVKERRQAERAQTIRQIVKQTEQERAAQPGYLSLDDAARKARSKARQERETWRLREEELRKMKDNPRPKQATLMDRHTEAVRKLSRREAALTRVAASLVPSENVGTVLSQYELDLVNGNLGEAHIL